MYNNSKIISCQANLRSWTLIGGWLVMLPTVYCFSRFFGWGVYGAWAGFTTFVALCGIVFAMRFVKGEWIDQIK